MYKEEITKKIYDLLEDADDKCESLLYDTEIYLKRISKYLEFISAECGQEWHSNYVNGYTELFKVIDETLENNSVFLEEHIDDDKEGEPSKEEWEVVKDFTDSYINILKSISKFLEEYANVVIALFDNKVFAFTEYLDNLKDNMREFYDLMDSANEDGYISDLTELNETAKNKIKELSK